MTSIKHERVVGPPFGDLRRHGDRPALLTDEAVITYEQLADRVDELAARLGGARRLVLVRGGSSVDTVVAYLAALQAGHPVILTPAARPDRPDPWLTTHDPDIVLDADGDGLRVDIRRADQRARAPPGPRDPADDVGLDRVAAAGPPVAHQRDVERGRHRRLPRPGRIGPRRAQPPAALLLRPVGAQQPPHRRCRRGRHRPVGRRRVLLDPDGGARRHRVRRRPAHVRPARRVRIRRSAS